MTSYFENTVNSPLTIIATFFLKSILRDSLQLYFRPNAAKDGCRNSLAQKQKYF